MAMIEDIICAEPHCVSLYVPTSKPLGAVLKHLDEEIIKCDDNVVKEILRSMIHLVNVYKPADLSVIIFMNENIVCIFIDRTVTTYGFYIDNKFFIQQDVDAHGDNPED